MIPKIIHYCWFGKGTMPDLSLKCLESWHRFMPDYTYLLWNEDCFDVKSIPYTKEAYEAGKYAFVSDVVRLYALKQFGGIYLDVDFEVYKPFDNLLHYKAFAGIEGSKYNPVMMGVIASEPEGDWINEQINNYQGRHFIIDGEQDLTTNVKFISDRMRENGFIPDGREQDYKDLHILPVEYFSPRLTTGEYKRNEHTYCEHKGIHSSWANQSWKSRLLAKVSPFLRTKIIVLKRRLIG